MPAAKRAQLPTPAAAGNRFRRNRLAGSSTVLLAVLLAIGLTTLPLSLRWYNVQSLDKAVRESPAGHAVVPYETYARELDHAKAGSWTMSAAPIAHRASSWMGHDDLGRSLLYRLWPGFLVSLVVGSAAALIAVVIGVTWGAVAGLAGGRTDAIMMRIVDVLYSLPYILMVILLKIALTRPLTALLGGRTAYADVLILLVAIGGVSWLTMARVVRGQVLSLREQAFVEASRAAGAGKLFILRRHLLPNLVGPVMACATLVVPQAILQEAFLSYLGIGVQQPLPSLGRLAADGVQAVNTFVGYWWLIVFPCGLLVITLLALNFIGDGLRDAFDPKSTAQTLA